MTANYHQFKSIILELLSTSSETEEVAVAYKLGNLFEQLLSESVTNKSYVSTKDTHIEGGIALSSQHALDCLKDPLRTVRFLKGVNLGIQEAQVRYPSGKIEILYAGCGPSAPLILPLLCLYTPEELSVTLLDITSTSIHSVSALVETLSVSAYIRAIVQEDATRYKFPKELPLHIVLSETMDKGLTKEPQVRITQNLVPQLAENGLLIPESIDIYAEHSFYAKEPYFDIYKNVLELGPTYKKARDRQFLFGISKDIPSEIPFHYTSPPIQAPQNFEETPDICLYAEVIIFKELKLQKSKSLLSNPICVASLYNLKGSSYTVTHTTVAIPDWNFNENN